MGLPTIASRYDMLESPPTRVRPETPALAAADASDRALADCLLGPGTALPLPPMADVVQAVLELALARRRKQLLPVLDLPAELALVRRGPSLLVSWYTTDGADVAILDRPVDLQAALTVGARWAADRLGGSDSSSSAHARWLHERLRAARVAPDPWPPGVAVTRVGGWVDPPSDGSPLAFGFEASVVPGALDTTDSTARADTHALLFEGVLWAWARERRVMLPRGPVVPLVARLVGLARVVLDTANGGRAANVRVRTGTVTLGVRVDPGAAVALTLGAESGEGVTIPALEPERFVGSVLRLGSDLCRAILLADRTQAHNLRLRAMRDEVRQLRAMLRRRSAPAPFTHPDPDALRVTLRDEAGDEPAEPETPTRTRGKLRFGERWRVALDELDATASFLCGDRIVVVGRRVSVALDRDDGRLLWTAAGAPRAGMAGRTLVRASGDVLELCDLDDGEPYATTRLALPPGDGLSGVWSGGGSLPPLLVVCDAAGRLVAIDLRTGEACWRRPMRGCSPPSLRRAGRLLLCGSADGRLEALDLVCGEPLWRHASREGFSLPPAVLRQTVFAVATAGGHGSLYALDLCSGRCLFRRPLSREPSHGPVIVGESVVLAVGHGREAALVAYDARDGAPRWSHPDIGLSHGGAALAVDDLLIVNAPGGRLTALDAADGRERWTRAVAHPLTDDVPRRLEPVLRGGALFVPGAHVWPVRPSDGAPLGDPLPCDLVPDLLRVDERGWVYVGEESGRLVALAPAPSLVLVRGGS
ncbi:MAG: PQQ-binding-like beta-propeller repeat protein [Myxococcota bacterium]|nr:PQQ-binding-like beta-propeller repeat protein [Myxococcota bacterium]MDW8361973.1 PQQ-binding-like beta-propeller repeat protein [Myxococcales bacterium]